MQACTIGAVNGIKRRSNCPISFGLDIFGDKWSLLIIRDLMFKGKVYYGDFADSEEKIASNILADRLQKLESAGVISKRQDPRKGTKYIYALTEKGIELLPVLVEMIIWGARHDPKTAAAKEFVVRAQKDRKGLMRDIVKSARQRAGAPDWS